MYSSSDSLSPFRREAEFKQLMPLHAPHAYEHCSPCFLHVHLSVLQPALQLHLIISINFMGAGGIEVWMGGIFSFLQPHSSDTSLLAQPFQS